MPVGLHRLQVVLAGYEPAILHDVVVRSNRITTVAVALDEAVGVREVVEVTPDYFSGVEEEAVSTVSFSFEEIRRSPGAAGDVSRMLQMLPSTGIQTDQRNDLIVRGGSPVENLTVVDNIEIPSINHFSTQGASGGVIGMLDTDLIADVSFSAGGFSAEHGDRLSSVMVVTQREGNRSEFDGEISASMAGAGVLLEGPLAFGRGAWVLSARRSFLDLIADAIGTGGVVPQYSNVQGMATLDVGPTHRIRLLGLGGFDAFHEDDRDGEIIADTRQYVGGANWRWLWSGDGYAETSLAYTRSAYRVSVTDAPAGAMRGPLLFDNESREEEVVLRSRWHYRPRTGTALTWGATARRSFSRASVFDAPELTRVNTVDERLDLNESLAAHKSGAFVSVDQSLGSRLVATLGGRFDYFLSVDVPVDVDCGRRHSPERQMAAGQRWLGGAPGRDDLVISPSRARSGGRGRKGFAPSLRFRSRLNSPSPSRSPSTSRLRPGLRRCATAATVSARLRGTSASTTTRLTRRCGGYCRGDRGLACSPARRFGPPA